MPRLTAAPITGQPISLAIPVPNKPTLVGQAFFCQAFELGSGTVHASAVVGGAAR